MIIIRTQRLVLRELESSDADFILELLNESSFLRFIGDKGVRTPADAREYIRQGPIDSYARNGFGLYLTTLGEGAPVGICGLVKREGLIDPDVGFAFLSRYQLQGYATEAAAAVVAHGWQALNLRRIVAITATENAGSIAVLEKIGLQFETMFRLAEDCPPLKLFATARPGKPA